MTAPSLEHLAHVTLSRGDIFNGVISLYQNNRADTIELSLGFKKREQSPLEEWHETCFQHSMRKQMSVSLTEVLSSAHRYYITLELACFHTDLYLHSTLY